jgi:SAM-dependent methyltransferase
MSEQTAPSTEGQESVDLERLYGSAYYAHYWGGGGPYERNDQWLQFFGGVADGLIRDFHPTSVLDAGCALGFLVETLRKRGVEADGFDISEFAISQVDESIAPHCRVATLTDPIERRYDLITCIEVLEHLPPEQADAAVANLCSATDLIVMSSTPGDYGEPTHLNVMQPEAWAVKFAQNGFYRDLDRDLAYLSPWAAVYVRRDEPQAETVRRYDRAWNRLRREVAEVRTSLIAAQNVLDTARTPERLDPNPELLKRTEDQEREILRLRDTLVGKDLELGAAKGRVQIAEDRAERMAALEQRVRGKVPGAGLFIGLLRRFVAGL